MRRLNKLWIYFLIVPFLGLVGCQKALREERNKAFLMDFMNEVLVKGKIDEKTIAHYLHPDFVQFVDDKTSNYQGFITHMKNLHSRGLKDLKIHYEHIIAKDDKVITVHYPSAKLPNGSLLRLKLIAVFGFKDGKIILCDELSHLLEGDVSYRNVGSH